MLGKDAAQKQEALGVKPIDWPADIPLRKFRVTFAGELVVEAYGAQHAARKILNEEFWREWLLDQALLITHIEEVK